jgi:hypothetical protein
MRCHLSPPVPELADPDRAATVAATRAATAALCAIAALIATTPATATTRGPAGPPEPVDVRVYRSRAEGQPRLLVPIDDYRRLATPPAPPAAPSPAPPTAVSEQVDRVVRVHASGRVAAQRAQVRLAIALDLASGRTPRSVPLFGPVQGAVVTRFSGSGELVQVAPDVWSLLTRDAGPARVEVELTMPAVRHGAAWGVSLPLPPAPEQTAELELADEGDVNVTATDGLVVSTERAGRATRIRAVGRGGHGLALRWEPPVQVEARPEVGAPAGEEFEPELSVQVASLVHVGDTHLKVKSSVLVHVRKNPVIDLTLATGASSSFVDVTGPQVAEWESVPGPPGTQMVRVALRSPVQDRLELAVESEVAAQPAVAAAAPARGAPASDQANAQGHATAIAGGRSRAALVVVHVPEAYQEDHAVGVLSPANLKVELDAGPAWSELDQARVPAHLAALTGQSLARLLRCERFLRARRGQPPQPITVEATRLEDVQLLQGTIDLMDAQSALTEDGQLVSRVTYRTRNNSQQFLAVAPPAGSRPLTVYVAGKAVRAASDAAGRWLIPLGKSGRVSGGAAPFDVEVTYLQEDVGPLRVGRALRLELPRADLGISTLRWTVAVPKDCCLAAKSGNVRSESSYRPVEFTTGDPGAAASAPAALFNESTLPLAIDLPRAPDRFHFSADLLDKDADARFVEVVIGKSVPALTRRAVAFLVGVLFFYAILRRRPQGRARLVATGLAFAGTGLLMALFGWAANTLGLGLHLVLGLFMGTVIFGLSRLAVGIGDPPAGGGHDDVL